MFARSFVLGHSKNISPATLGGEDIDNLFPSLSLMATLNMKDVADRFSSEWPDVTPPFPTTGYMRFYYDMANQPWGSEPFDRDGVKVVWSEQRPNVRGGRSLALTPVVSQPSSERMDDPLDDDRYDDYLNALEDLQNPSGLRHQLFGYPVPVQSDDFEQSCVAMAKFAYSLDSAPEEWILLLQLDSDDDMGWMFGDTGTIYYFIRKDDLKNDDFSKVWISLQCC